MGMKKLQRLKKPSPTSSKCSSCREKTPWKALRRLTVCLVAVSLAVIAIDCLDIMPLSTTLTKAKADWIETISLEENATLSADIVSILHHPQEAKLVVTIRPGARCPKPYLVGRLAGPALVKVENWTREVGINGTTILQGNYQAPVGGMYFLEIVTLYCEDLFYLLHPGREEAGNHTNATTMFQQKDWTTINTPVNDLLRRDFQRYCMIETQRHRITSEEVVIWVDHDTALAKQKDNPKPGFWWFTANRTTSDNPEDVTLPPTSAPGTTPAPTTPMPTTLAPTTQQESNRECKIYMVVGDKNKDYYMNANSEFVDWLNKMSLPHPLFVGATFETLPASLLLMYKKYADRYSATNEIDIHGAWVDTQPTSPEQGASLDLLCKQAKILLKQLRPSLLPSTVASSLANATTRRLRATTEASIASMATSLRPLYTRYQTYECMYAHTHKQPLPQQCQEAATVHRFDPFEFKWSTSDDNRPGLTVQDLTQPHPTVICVMGHSHARTLWHAGERLGLVPGGPTNVTVEWTDAYYPSDVNPAKVQAYRDQKHCSKLIIAVGQWPASFVGGAPQGLLEYYLRIQHMLASLKNSGLTQQMDISMRSIHYNPPSHGISSCPPTGWRNPLVIDAYNTITQRVCLELDIPYLDTNFLVGPVWDSAPDWCHLNDHASEQEMLYLAAQVLGVWGNNNGDVAPAEKEGDHE